MDIIVLCFFGWWIMPKFYIRLVSFDKKKKHMILLGLCKANNHFGTVLGRHLMPNSVPWSKTSCVNHTICIQNTIIRSGIQQISVVFIQLVRGIYFVHSKAMMVIEIGLGKWHFDTFEKEIPPAVHLSITPFYM